MAEDLLARNLVIIGLDRLGDFTGPKSEIIVRETSAQLIQKLLTQEKLFSQDEIISVIQLLH
jgi:hypothetical protein